MKQSLITLLLLPCLASAQSSPSDFDKFFDNLLEKEIQARIHQVVPAAVVDRLNASTSIPKQAVQASQFSNIVVRTPGGSNLNGITSVERAAASIKTDIEGAEAGVQFAPFRESSQPVVTGATITLAALKEGITRIAIGDAFEFFDGPSMLSELDHGCSNQFDPLKLRIAIESQRENYRAVCKMIQRLPQPSSSTRYDEARDFVASACNLQSSYQTPTFATGKSQITEYLEIYIKHSSIDTSLQSRASRELGGQQKEIEAIVNFSFNALLKCPDDKGLKQALAKWRWKNPSIRIGFGIQADFFPLLWGFHPSCEDANDPTQVKDTEDCKAGSRSVALRGFEPSTELSFIQGGFSFLGNLGVTATRKHRGAAYLWNLAPKLSVDHVVSRLGTEEVTSKNSPRISLGIDASVQVSFDKPDDQKELVAAATISPHADFILSEDLSIRLGIPLKAEQKTRDKTDTLPKKTALQWTVPAFIATVLKFD